MRVKKSRLLFGIVLLGLCLGTCTFLWRMADAEDRYELSYTHATDCLTHRTVVSVSTSSLTCEDCRGRFLAGSAPEGYVADNARWLTVRYSGPFLWWLDTSQSIIRRLPDRFGYGWPHALVVLCPALAVGFAGVYLAATSWRRRD